MERRIEGRKLPNDVLLMYIGTWSDKHDYVYCCDLSSPLSGRIFDVLDDHTWSGESFYDFETDETVLEFLDDL